VGPACHEGVSMYASKSGRGHVVCWSTGEFSVHSLDELKIIPQMAEKQAQEQPS